MSIVFFTRPLHAEDGYRLWLRYDLIKNKKQLAVYKSYITQVVTEGKSATSVVTKDELVNGLSGLLGTTVTLTSGVTQNGTIIAGTPENSALIKSLHLEATLKKLGKEGFIITTAKIGTYRVIAIAGNSDAAVLYGAFHFLKLIQTQQDISKLSIGRTPKIVHRILNHWDNLDRTVERGYAGFSLWDWHKLPDYIDSRYTDYARANASVGINGTVLNNVNANALILTPAYLQKVAALADVFRPYGIKVYLTARFSAPVEIGNMKTADPLDPQVAAWWKEKTSEIYQYVPDFGGFLVKANSEGQPGPQNYGRNHADGANMLADALAPYGGIVMWRAFVYDNNVPDDRSKQAYNEFKPLDGKFRSNVLIQVKNGAIDFQPREPFHPLFGAMPQTPLMMEFQLTQEYLGFATHLVYLPVLYKETLDADTYAKGKGSFVSKIIDGSIDNHTLSGIAGVANIGNERNWCGHPFAQSNWYGFGRLAWDPTLSAENIADEWIRMTFTNDSGFTKNVKSMMMASREITVNYMTPLGLHHIMGWNHHYGPGPWIKNKPRADWTSVYYHRADSNGLGFDRTSTGSNAIGQYDPVVQKIDGNLNTCPEKLLLWFHHVKWDHPLKSGRTLWNELCFKYQTGSDSVYWMQKTWDAQQGKVDHERFQQVKMLLAIQAKEAQWWRNACITYFQTFSKRPIPAGYSKPAYSLDHYVNTEFHFVPGIKND